MRAVPVVAYPAPENGDSFARSIVARWIEGHQREIAIRFPMRPGPPPVKIYDDAAAELAAELEDGRDVALLCQGDPLFYGSFINIFTRLAGRYQIEIVPGVSSLTACAAAAAIPLVARDDALAVIPATLDEDQIAARLAASDTAVAVSFDLRMDQTSRQSLANLANRNAKSITMVGLLGPAALGVLGLILLLFAFTPWRHLRRPPHDADDGPSHFDLLPGSSSTDG